VELASVKASVKGRGKIIKGGVVNDRTLFVYRPGSDPVRTYDPRLKLPLLLFWLSGTALAPPPLFPLLLLPPAAAMIAARISPLTLLWESKLFLFLSAALFLSGTLRGEMLQGAFSAFRFLLVVTGGRILIETSKTSALAHAIYSYIRPFHERGAAVFSIHVMLTLRFIPMIFTALDEVTLARKSRGIDLSRNPFVRVKSLILPLFALLLQRSSEMADALGSRGLSSRGWQGAPLPAIRKNQWLIFLLLSLLVLAPVLLYLFCFF
jgi:energy-coupling factor transporter transmembrane protein EcfT